MRKTEQKRKSPLSANKLKLTITSQQNLHPSRLFLLWLKTGEDEENNNEKLKRVYRGKRRPGDDNNNKLYYFPISLVDEVPSYS